VLVVTGPIGVGKSAVVRRATSLLVAAGIPHAAIMMEEIAGCWPEPPEDPAVRVAQLYQNLASLWSNYESRGAGRLLLEMLVEHRSDLRPLHEAIPAADITVVRLQAPLAIIEERIRHREPYPDDELGGARWWQPRMDRLAVEDFLVDNNAHRQLPDVASEVLHRAGWLERVC